MDEPVCRASYFVGNIEALDVLGAQKAAQVRATAADAIRHITSVPRTAWISYGFDVEINNAIVQVAGVAGVIAVNRASVLASIDGPLLRPFVDGTVALFGLTPTSMLKMAPRVWASVTMNAGRLRVEPVTSTSVRLFHENLPPSLAPLDDYHRGIEGIVQGIFDATKRTGTTTFERTSDTAICVLGSWS